MSLSHGILGFLSYSNMTGYDLAKIFDSSVKFFWYARANHIYLELTKLEKKSYVKCEYIVQQDKPNKKLYHITDEGKKEFLRWLATNTDDVQKSKNEFLMRVFFSGSSTIDQSIEVFKKLTAISTSKAWVPYHQALMNTKNLLNLYNHYIGNLLLTMDLNLQR